jgi:hypothetical protein
MGNGANPMPRTGSGPAFVGTIQNIYMAADKKGQKKSDPASKAYEQAEKDILHDPELSDSDPTDDLDEGELARKDNSDEEALDNLEKPRSGGHSAKDHHSGKGKEK